MPINKNISQRNQRGIIVLILLLCVIIFAPRLYMLFTTPEPMVITVQEADQHVASIEKGKTKKKQQQTKQSKFKRPPRKFDPNTYTHAQWMELGLSEKQANVAINFAKRGLYSNEDLQQVFVINEELFALLKDSTYYPEKNIAVHSAEKRETVRKTVELNTANRDELLTISGIGEFYADKIIEHRTNLGGFHSKSQLLELYKFDQEKLDKINAQITVSGQTQQLSINTSTAEQLAKHPYIKWKIANSIVKMRVKHTRYSKLEQLLESELIDQALLDKLRPYLTLD